MKKQNGITLISLVVTIVVLIILAGVSINLILGQDGIITKAREAKQNMELAADEEARSLNELYAQMSGESSGELSYDAISKLVEFKREIASAISDMGVETATNADATTMASNIRSIVGTTTAEKVSYNNSNSGLTSTNVQGAVDELNDSLTKQTVNYSVDTNYIADYAFYCLKFNDVCLGNGNFMIKSINANTWTVIANGFPQCVGIARGAVVQASGVYNGIWQLNSDGSLYLYLQYSITTPTEISLSGFHYRINS